MTGYAYGVGFWLILVGIFGVVRSANLVHTVVCVSVAQSGTYAILLAIGFQQGAVAPIFGSSSPPGTPVVDPVVQAMTLTDIVVSATVTALLLSIVVQIAKRHGTIAPDELHALHG
jgi:multicomponent Na+:H+ antiporter subunit C